MMTSHKNARRVIFLPVSLSVDLVELLRSMAFGGGAGGNGSAERCLERGRGLVGDNSGPIFLTGRLLMDSCYIAKRISEVKNG